MLPANRNRYPSCSSFSLVVPRGVRRIGGAPSSPFSASIINRRPVCWSPLSRCTSPSRNLNAAYVASAKWPSSNNSETFDGSASCMSRSTNGCRASRAPRSRSVRWYARRAIRSSSASASGIDEVLADAAEYLVVDPLVLGYREVQLNPDRNAQGPDAARRWDRHRDGLGNDAPGGCAMLRGPSGTRPAIRGWSRWSAVAGEAGKRQEGDGLLLADPCARRIGPAEERNEPPLVGGPRVVPQVLEKRAVGLAHQDAEGLAELRVV